MKNLIYISILTGLLCSSCTNNQSAGTYQPLTTAAQDDYPKAPPEITSDSISGFVVGDCYRLKNSNLNYGFILLRMRPNIYNFAPVYLDSTSKGFKQFENGMVDIVPQVRLEVDEPLNDSTIPLDELSIQCIGLMRQDDVKEFLGAFEKTGHFDLRDKRPAVSSFYNVMNESEVQQFIKQSKDMWANKHRLVPVKELCK